MIMYVGTNDLNSGNNPQIVAKPIIDLAKGMVSEKRKVTLSGIILRNDEWYKKTEKVNQHLKDMCQTASIDYMDNSSLNPKKLLSNSKLHLNEKGSYKLNSVLSNYITTLFKSYESESLVGKDSLHDIALLNQSDNETTESDSTTFPSSNLKFESRYFGNELKSFRINNINCVIIGQININSIRSKFIDLVKRVRSNIDILMISETKLDVSFLTSFLQFLINGYTSPCRLDRNGKGGGILVYVQEDMPSKLITTNFLNAERFFLEINLRRKKWVISVHIIYTIKQSCGKYGQGC